MPSTDPNPCHACEQSFCCDSFSACTANPDCFAFRACYVACNGGQPDEAGVHDAGPPDGALPCDEYCLQAHPTGLVDFAPLLGCTSVLCVSACSNGMPTPCGACLAANCPNEEADVQGTQDGWLLLDCTTPCLDAACLAACEDAYPKAKAAYEAFNACGISKCTPECQ
jgi:hypothetical protein